MRERRKLYYRGILFILALFLGVWAFSPRSGSVAAQSGNLLANPSFEGAYSSFDPEPDIPDCQLGICTTAQMAAGWWPWWVSQTDADPDWKNRMPEYKPATAPFTNRIHGGATAQQYFTFHSTHVAGLWQRVNVPANSQLRFAIWGHAWSSATSVSYSDFPTAVNMRIGIDPTGGTNPFSGSIVWSGVANVYDNYALFTVEAQAQGDRVTVFTYSAPQEARKHNDIYWDDAALTVIGGAPPPPPADDNAGSGNAAPPPAPAPAQAVVARPLGPTPTPNAQGIIEVIVQPGDALWSIAARAGLSLDELLALNNISRDAFINIGDTIIIGSGEPGVPEAEAPATVEAVADEPVDTEVPEAAEQSVLVEESDTAVAAEGIVVAEAAPAAEANAAPPPVASEKAVTGAICFKAYDDTNGNGFHDGGEALREAVAITIATDTSVVSNYITDGASEPYCIQGLEAGAYRVNRSKLGTERLTTPGDWAVTLAEGGTLNIEFGSVVEADTVAVANSLAGANSLVNTASDQGALQGATAEGGPNALVIAVIVIAVLLLGGVLFLILSARRATS